MTDLLDLDLLLVDCQTTGASPAHGRILELGWMRYRASDPLPDHGDDALRAELAALPDDQGLPRRVADLTGITDEMLADAAPLDAIWRDFHEAAESADRLAAHYAQFERRFLDDLESGRTGEESLAPVLCAHAIAERLYPGLPRRGLRALAGFVGHPVDEPNRAAPHVLATAAIWRHLVHELDERADVTTLDGLRMWLETPPASSDGPTYALDRDRRLELPDRPGVYHLVGADDRPLYVGKATSLKRRVNQYFQTRKGLAEHKLELVSQVHDLDVRPTATPLEAALIETDRIKELAPPYNRALGADGRAVLRPDTGRYGAIATEALRPVTVRDKRVISTLLEWGDEKGRNALAGVSPATLYAIGMHLWPPPDRDDGAVLSPVDRLASLIRRIAAEIRRGIWLGRLPGSALAWKPENWQGDESWRLLELDGCEVANVETVAGREDAESRIREWEGTGAAIETIADWDRLRVLTTELRRLVGGGQTVVLRTPRTAFDRQALEACLAFV